MQELSVEYNLSDLCKGSIYVGNEKVKGDNQINEVCILFSGYIISHFLGNDGIMQSRPCESRLSVLFM